MAASEKTQNIAKILKILTFQDSKYQIIFCLDKKAATDSKNCFQYFSC